MKDINIIMPEEVKNEEKVFFICIDEGIIDMNKKYVVLCSKSLRSEH